jgi:hypothetical protein
LNRAIRRHHRNRMLNKVRWYYGGDRKYSKEGHAVVVENSREVCARLISARQPCSCPMCCGNPRRIRGRKYVTRQELKAGVNGRLRS